MYSYSTPLEMRMDILNSNQIILFDHFEPFDETIANQMIEEGLNLKVIENDIVKTNKLNIAIYYYYCLFQIRILFKKICHGKLGCRK